MENIITVNESTNESNNESNNESTNEKSIGFIILRHVNSELTDKYWNLCYDRIREYYPENSILIIDDNSNYDFITTRELYNTTIINSEYPGRGELLPYYYYLKNKFADIAVILHDSVFINQYFDFTVEKYHFIWAFDHNWDNTEKEINIIKLFNNDDLLNFYNNKNWWYGCFGGMSAITHDYLTLVNNKYNIDLLLDVIINRELRSCFERIIACLLCIESHETCFLGNIYNYGIHSFSLHFNERHLTEHLPLTKIWTGR